MMLIQERLRRNGGKMIREIQIRNVNQRQINKIVNILFEECYGEFTRDAYKNEEGEWVGEFVFSGFEKPSQKTEGRSK